MLLWIPPPPPPSTATISPAHHTQAALNHLCCSRHMFHGVRQPSTERALLWPLLVFLVQESLQEHARGLGWWFCDTLTIVVSSVCYQSTVFMALGIEKTSPLSSENSASTTIRVNDIAGHITCYVCALKSHILQTRLTGHTTCEMCASEVTNRSAIRFLVKKYVTR
jgi:hypothetical protein